MAGNVDFYSNSVSKLANVAVAAGAQYFLVIDGFGGDFGDDNLSIFEFEPCEFDIPAYVTEEMERPLTDDYVDLRNGGCNTVWLRVGPTVFAAPDGHVGYEFDYVIMVVGGAVVTEDHTWGSIRDLYR